jgi:hypothetical protein
MMYTGRTQYIASSVFVVFMLCISTFTGGCGGSGTPIGGDGGSSQSASTKTNYCTSAEECHASIANLVIQTAKKPTLCTGFLSEPSVIATSAHCVPKELRAAEAICSDDIQVIFPATPGLPQQSLKCLSVIATTDNRDRYLPDYAFLRIEPVSGRNPLRIDTSLPKTLTSLDMLAVEPQGLKPYSGKLRRATCNILRKTFVTEQFEDGAAPVLHLGQCIIRRANAGSPLIDSNAMVRGLVDLRLTANDARLAIDDRSLITRDFAHMGIATVSSCLAMDTRHWDSLDASLKASCNLNDQSSKEKRWARAAQKLESDPMAGKRLEMELEANATAWARASLGTKIRWSMTSITDRDSRLAVYYDKELAGDDVEDLLTPVPLCLPTQKSWLDSFKANGDYLEEATQKFHIAVWKMIDEGIGFNSMLRLSLNIKSLREGPLATLTIHPREAAKTGKMVYSIELDQIEDANADKREQSEIIVSDQLSTCQ